MFNTALQYIFNDLNIQFSIKQNRVQTQRVCLSILFGRKQPLLPRTKDQEKTFLKENYTNIMFGYFPFTLRIIPFK